jgi:hypothetical protein
MLNDEFINLIQNTYFGYIFLFFFYFKNSIHNKVMFLIMQGFC